VCVVRAFALTVCVFGASICTHGVCVCGASICTHGVCVWCEHSVKRF